MFDSGRFIGWIGDVDLDNTRRVSSDILRLHKEDPEKPITLLVSSGGGSSYLGYGFYDLIQTLSIPLHTVVSGSADSIAVIIFLAGQRRYVSHHATMLLHEGSRRFPVDRRYTSRELKGFGEEDAIYDEYYGAICLERTEGKLSRELLTELMLGCTVLNPQKMIEFGFAHSLWLPNINNPA